MAGLRTTWARRLEGEDARDYDSLVLASASGHFAQSRAWAHVAERSRPCRPRFFLARDGAGRAVGAALVLRASLGPVVLPFGEVDRGPVCREVSDVGGVADALAATARAHGIARVAVMPYWSGRLAERAEEELAQARFALVQRPDGSHAATLRLTLAGAGRSPQEVLAGGERAQLRRWWRQATAAGATAAQGGREALDEHRRLVALRALADGHRDKTIAWYDALSTWLADGRGAIFTCRFEERTISTVVALRHADFAVYALGATVPGPCRINKSVLPLIAAIRWAKDVGCATFDLGGVPLPEDDDAKRGAIARFKLHFSRDVVRLVRRHARWF